MVDAKANFFDDIKYNLKKAFTPSEFVCTKYEKQEYETLVLRPGIHLPFTETRPKKRICIRWEKSETAALGRTCVEYGYQNSGPKEENALYRKVKRYRTVCKDGYSTR